MASPECGPARCDYCGSRPCVGDDCPQHWYEDDEAYDDGEWEPCWHCGGAGEFDEADYDGVNYAPGEDVTDCPECNGRGGWYA